MTMHVVKGSDGLNRRAFTAEDVRRMVKARIIDEHENVELVDGELIAMSPKGYAHDRVRDELNWALIRAVDDEVGVSVEGTLQLDPMTLVEPDILVFRKADSFASREGFKVVPPASVLLAVEISVTSLSYDRRRKAQLYAAYGVPEYWIVDLNRLRTFVHLSPEVDGYRDIKEVRGSESLAPRASGLAGYALRLADHA